MAKSKKAQILAAVMCATTVVGVSPAISSAADHIISDNNKAFIEAIDAGDEAGAINAQANNLTFTVGNNTFAMDQYSTTITGTLNVDGNVNSTGNVVSHTANGNEYSLNQIGQKTAGIYSEGQGTTTIEGTTFSNGTIEADEVNSTGDVVSHTANGNEYSLNQIGQKTSGIYSDGMGTTTVENATTFTSNGMTTVALTTDSINTTTGTLNVDSNVNSTGDVVSHTTNGNEYSLNQIGQKTSGIYSDGQGTTTVEGTTFNNGTIETDGVNSTGDVVSHINGNEYSLNQIGQKTSGIYSDGIGTTTIEGTTFNNGTITADTITAGTLNVGDFNVNGKVNVSGDVVTTENGNEYSLVNIGKKVQGISSEDSDGDGSLDTTIVNGSTFFDGGNFTTGNLTAETATIRGNAFVNGDFNANNGQAIISTNGDNVYVSTSKGHMNLTADNTVLGYGASNVTFDGNGATFTNGNNGSTVINGGTITTDKLVVGGVDVGEMAGTTNAIADKVQGIEHGQYKDPTTGEVTGEYTKVEDVYISGTNINAGGFTVTDGNVNTTGDVVVGGDLTVVGTINGKDITDIATGADVSAVVGDTSKLTTTDKTNVVNAVNEVNGKVGDLKALDGDITARQEYKDNQSLVGAINAESAMRQELSGRVDNLDSRVGSLEERMGDVEDRIDKVGAMSAAIANLRTMGYDPEAPTEIAVGVGQYKSETGLALGVFHYPNEDFMLSASISTSGDEVMGGIGATWKLGRKSASERAVNKEKSRELKAEEKAAEMKEAAQKSKVDAQRERHAKMLAEREAANK